MGVFGMAYLDDLERPPREALAGQRGLDVMDVQDAEALFLALGQDRLNGLVKALFRLYSVVERFHGHFLYSDFDVPVAPGGEGFQGLEDGGGQGRQQDEEGRRRPPPGPPQPAEEADGQI